MKSGIFLLVLDIIHKINIMNEYLFECGHGWLSKKVAKIAQKHGAILVNHQDPQCQCGHGCSPFECIQSRRHWFACDNLGSPFNERISNMIMNLNLDTL